MDTDRLRPAAPARRPGGVRGPWSRTDPAVFVLVAGVLLASFGWLLGAFDLHSILRAARALTDGRDPYSPVTSPLFRSGHAFVYPYMVAWVFVPLALLPAPLAVAIFLLLSVAAILAACHLLGRPGLLPAALVLSSSTTIVGLQMGTVNALLFLAVALAWSRRDRPVVAGLAVAAGAATKLFLLPLLGWLVLGRRLRAAAVATGALVAVLGAGWVLGPLDEHGYTAMLNALQRNEASSSWSLTSLMQSLGVGPATAETAAIGVAAAVVVAGAIRARRQADERVLFASAVIASLLATPIMWSSYLLVLVSVVLVVATDDRAVAVMALASWAVVTPDAAPAPRVAAGVAVTAALAVVAFGPWRGWVGGRWQIGPGAAARAAGLVGSVALAGAVLAAVPAGVRSALPAMLLMAGAGVEASRRAARRSGHRARGPDGCHPSG